MNKKGFTLIELIGSIIIIAALALLAFPAILSLLNSGQEQVDDSVIKFVKSAAEECVNENINENINDYSKCKSFKNLKNNGYISTTFYEKYKGDITKTIVITENTSKSKFCYGYGNNDQEYDECKQS